MAVTIFVIITLGKRLVLIRKQLLVQIQDVRLLADEAHAAGVLTGFVHLHAKHLGHLVLVVDEVAPLLASLEDNLQALAGWRDVDEQNTEFISTLLKVCGSKFFTLNS